MNILNKIYVDYADWKNEIVNKALVLTSKGRVETDFFRKNFSKNPVVVVEAEPNIEYLDFLYKKLVSKNNINLLVAYGGGSVIDAAKILALSLFNKKMPSSFLDNFSAVQRIGLFVVPTTFGSGSEVTSIGVYKKNGKKISIKNDLLIPDKIFLFSQIFDDISTADSRIFVADAFCHAVESFYSKNSNRISKHLSALALRLICENLSFRDKISLMFASTIAGIAENIAGVASIHALAYPLQNKFNLPHARANSIILGCLKNDLLLGDKGFSELKRYGFDEKNMKRAIAKLKSNIPDKLLKIPGEVMAEDCLSYSKLLSNCQVSIGKKFLVEFYEKFY